jgi:hypothetical protein
MWKWALFNGALFWLVSAVGDIYRISPLLLAVIFAVLHHLLGKQVMRLTEGFDYMPDSHKTTCAKGSVPAANGLDCKLPTDRYGL